MEMERRSRIGFGIACFGLATALLALVPGIADHQFLPWPLFVGSAIYLAGGILLAINARGSNGRKAMFWLRIVRMGFVVIVFLMFMRMSPR